MNTRIQSFDSFRYILALLVLFGHTFVMLYRTNNFIIEVHNVAVDGFFILSGFLIALSTSKVIVNDPTNCFYYLTIKRLKRLWPEFIFAVILGYGIRLFFFNNNLWRAIPFSVCLLTDVNKFPTIVVGSWYVCVLFYVGALMQALLVYKPKISRIFFIPLIIFLCVGYLYPTSGNLVLYGANKLLFNSFPSAFLKGFMDIGIGIECYFIAQYFKTHSSILKQKYERIFLLCAEVLGLSLILYAWFKVGASRDDFFVLFGYVIIILMLAGQKEYFLRFLSWPVWKYITNTAYMLYLTHVLILSLIKKYISYKEYPEVVVYATVIVCCGSIAFICYHVQKKLFAKLKEMIMIPQSVTGAKNVGNLERERERERDSSCQAS